MVRTVLAAVVLASLPALAQPVPGDAAAYFRTIRAARRLGPIEIDGLMNEQAWQAAELGDRFTQYSPDAGQPASVETRFRVLWDDEAIYVGVECDDAEPITATLSRRDRFIQGDWISFDLDTTNDRRTAYHFQVYAGGHQVDGLHFNDIQLTTDWDAAWESAVARTPAGWSVEVRIPLRILRIPEGTTGFGFNLYRNLARRQEEDQWRYRPRTASGDVSLLGELVGLDGIHPVRSLELRPYLAARSTMTRPPPARARAPFLVAPCPSVGFSDRGLAAGCVGLDLRYSLFSDLSLVATVNPDFGQVEADQRVLNLSTFETFFPEKRPFFTEGLDLFQSPLRIQFGGPYGGDAYQIFYSRRIGRAPPKWDDGPWADGTLIYQPAARPVLEAVKLTGKLGPSSVGLLTSFEPRVHAQALLGTDGTISEVRVAEAVHSAAARVRTPLGPRTLLGVFGTAVDPMFTQSQTDRRRRHAHVGGADLTTYNADRTWSLTAQGAGSLLTGGERDPQDDGTVWQDGSSGVALSAKVAKDGGSIVGFAGSDWLTPQFTVNDLGFMRRANLFRSFGYLQLRDVHPNDWRQRAFLGFWGREIRNGDLALSIYHDVGSEAYMKLNSQWNFYAYGVVSPPFVDDRELGDGTPIERQGSWGGGANFDSDSRKPVQFGSFVDYSRAAPRFERGYAFGAYLTVRPFSQLEGTLELSFNRSDGTIRRIRRARDLADVTRKLDKGEAAQRDRLYLLAPQAARSVSTLLRGTYAFSPHLTLQLYAQFFAAGVAYGDPLRAVSAPGKRTVRFSDLSPAIAADQVPDDVDDREAGLNVNLILRWEWRLGSTLYLVYAHQSSNDFAPSRRGLSFADELGTFAAAGAKHEDTFLVKVDLFQAL